MSVVILGMRAYQTLAYKNFWKQYTGSVEAMRKAVAILKASPYVDLPTIEYGHYQPFLAPLSDWARLGSKFWAKEIGGARRDLIDQLNGDALSDDEPDVKPKTRLALMDAAIRKCFNSEPPIPIDATIDMKKSTDHDRDVHTVEIGWVYGKGDRKTPILFKYKLICPYKPTPSRNKPKSSQNRKKI